MPKGLQTENHYLYTLYDADDPVGMIWIRADLQSPIKNGFIFELYVDEKFRGKGYGKQALVALDEKIKSMDVQSGWVACFR